MIFKIYNFLISPVTKLINPVKKNEIGKLKKADVWIHCCSLGEVMAAKSLIDELLSRNKKIFLTAFTSSGLNKAQELWGEKIQILRFPLDEKARIMRIISRVSPEIFIDVETELWPNMLTQMRKFKIPAFLVNARISAKNYRRIKYFKKVFRMLLSIFVRIYAQSAADARRILSFGINPDKIKITGNLKYDSVDIEDRASREGLGIESSSFVITFGSIRSKEEDQIIEAIFQLLHKLEDIYIIIAPRHLDRVDIIKTKLKRKSLDYNTRSTEPYPQKGKVFILDTLGELREFYSISDVAFVGGSLEDYGGHNIMEPASFGIPVLFGPYISNVESIAYYILKSKGGMVVRNVHELVEEVTRLYQRDGLRRKMGQNALKAIVQKQGIAKEIIQDIEDTLSYLPPQS